MSSNANTNPATAPQRSPSNNSDNSNSSDNSVNVPKQMGLEAIRVESRPETPLPSGVANTNNNASIATAGTVTNSFGNSSLSSSVGNFSPVLSGVPCGVLSKDPNANNANTSVLSTPASPAAMALASVVAADPAVQKQQQNIAAILHASPKTTMIFHVPCFQPGMMNTSLTNVGGVSFSDGDLSAGAAAPPAAPLPSYDELMGQIADDEERKALALPPITMADVMDCFRMYFGSSVTTFPFYAARLGAVGFVFVISAAIGINLSTQNSLHRTRYNLVLLELHRRLGREQRVRADAAKTASSATESAQEAIAALTLARIASTQSLSCPGSPTTTTVGNIIASAAAEKKDTAVVDIEMGDAQQKQVTTVTAAAAKKKKSSFTPTKALEEISDLMPYFMRLGTLVKLSNQLWPDHWLKQAITICTFISQFFTCCSFSLLFARNLAPVVGINDDLAVYVSAAAYATLTLATSAKTKTILAYCNNIFIFGGAGFLLFASLTHEASEEEKAMPLQILPKSISQFAIYAPSVIAYLSVQLLTVDVESLLAVRCLKACQKGDGSAGTAPSADGANAITINRPAPTTPTLTPSAQGALNMLFEGGNSSNGSATASNAGSTSAATSPTLSRTASLQSFAATPVTAGSGAFPASLPSKAVTSPMPLSGDRVRASMADIHLVKRYYQRALFLGAAASILVLLFFAELIMNCFKDNTNAIIALSLPESAIRTAILICLSIGLYACGALNISPICDLLDMISGKTPVLDFMPILKRAGLRAVLFIIVIAFLYLVPFFDLVAGLSGAICTPAFAFFIPSACEMQSEIMKAAAHPSTKLIMQSMPLTQRCLIAWGNMPVRAKLTFAVSMTLGSCIFVFSTAMVIQETLRRHNEGE